MSKRFKGDRCTYCCIADAITGDHVFAREFFLVEDRDNLPQVPTCDRCNNEKSKLEHYLTTVLPFAGRHPQAMENLKTGVPKRLKSNQKLNRELLFSKRPAWMLDGGLYRPTSMMPFKGEKLQELLKYVARGLAWHHWKVYVPFHIAVKSMILTEVGNAAWVEMVNRMSIGRTVYENLGRGTVVYEGAQSPDTPEVTVWVVSMYGGMVFSDDRVREKGDSATWLWMITGVPGLDDIVKD